MATIPITSPAIPDKEIISKDILHLLNPAFLLYTKICQDTNKVNDKGVKKTPQYHKPQKQI
jgi:hypothetical protein